MFDLSRTGVVVNAVRVANALARRGHRVVLLVLRDTGRDAWQLEPGVAVETVREAAGGKSSRRAAMFGSIGALRRQLRMLKPQVLVSAGNHAHQSATLASLGLPGIVRILRISNELDHVGDGLARKLWRRIVRRFIYHYADRLLLVSAHLAGDPLLSGAVANGRAVIVPNGVDVAQIRRRASVPFAHPVLTDAIPYVVSVGRLASHKNFTTLIRAFARAVASRPMKLLIIGGGTGDQREQLEALAAAMGVADSVQLEGEIDNPMPLVAGAAAFALPSLWEGASNALLEALALDVPIVASRSAGNAQEVLGDGRFGLLVDPLDINGMAQALLHQTSADARRPGNRAADFSADDAIARVCQAIVELAAPRGGSLTRSVLPEGT